MVKAGGGKRAKLKKDQYIPDHVYYATYGPAQLDRKENMII